MIGIVSIIVCTRNRYLDLKSCIESINTASEIYRYKELIIVDSSDDKFIRDGNQKIAIEYNCIYVHESRKGLSIARNTGIKKSSGDIIIFADDDFIVDENWVSNLVKNYSDDNVMCCTGRMLPYNKNEASDLYEKSLSFDKGTKRYEIVKENMNMSSIFKTIPDIGKKQLRDKTPPPYNVGYGLCSFKKVIFEKIGLFDEKLGRGTSYIGSDDIDIYYRILKSGYKIVYEPTAFTYHVHRLTKDAVLKDAHNAGVSVKVFTTKYIKTGDVYILMLFFGYLILLISSLIKAMTCLNKDVALMIRNELKGFINGPIYK